MGNKIVSLQIQQLFDQLITYTNDNCNQLTQKSHFYKQQTSHRNLNELSPNCKHIFILVPIEINIESKTNLPETSKTKNNRRIKTNLISDSVFLLCEVTKHLGRFSHFLTNFNKKIKFKNSRKKEKRK